MPIPKPPSTPSPEPDETRQLALILAVLSHGLSNFAEGSVPAGWRTILQTSEHYRSYLSGKMPQDD